MLAVIPSEDRLLVNTPHGYGFTFAIESSGSENLTWTVVLKEDGRILQYNTLQLRAACNHTLEINLKDEMPAFPSAETTNTHKDPHKKDG